MADEGKIHDTPMERVTTNSDDLLPHEFSAMDSAATEGDPFESRRHVERDNTYDSATFERQNTYDSAAEYTDADADDFDQDSQATPTDGDPCNVGVNQDTVTSMVSGGDRGPDGAESLASARAHLAAVAEELAMIQSQVDQSFADQNAGPADVDDSRERERSEQRERDAILIQSKQELERQKRHLEVDLECANTRADRFAQEKEELLAVKARMAEDLRGVRKLLEEARLQQQHRDMEHRKLGGYALGPPDSSLGIREPSPEPIVGVMIEQAGLGPKPANAMSKQQAVAALRTARADLLEERKRRERLERRVQKDKERLERLVAVAEAQQGEIRSLEKRCWDSEVCAEDCQGRLQKSEADNEALMAALQGKSPGSKGSNKGSSQPGSSRLTTPPGGRVTPAMLRQQSAPTRLPTVVDAAPKRG